MKTLITILFLLLALGLDTHGQSSRDKAIDLYRMGEYEESLRILEQLRAVSEIDYLGASYLGAAYLKVNKTKEARDVFSKLRSFKEPRTPLVYERKIKVTNRPKARCAVSELGSFFAKIAVELNAEGKIGFAFPFSDNSLSLRQTSVEAAKNIQFEPAITNGKAVPVVLVFEYTCVSFDRE